VGLWIVSAVVAAAFVFFGSGKLMGSEMYVQGFEKWGYPLWFMYLIGALEVVGGIALLVPRIASYGALALAVVMLGATFTHLASYEYTSLLMPLVFLGLHLLIAWGRWPRLAVPSFLRMTA
jgi:uncharacterized membrane protein YphA (DoxX/SURF4 family)